MMFDLTNIREINAQYGHRAGNALINHFSSVLKTSAVGLCFVGRNGGNKFLALFEHATPEAMDTFVSNLEKNVEEYNRTAQQKLEYKSGRAVQKEDAAGDITELIALSNRRIYASEETAS